MKNDLILKFTKVSESFRIQLTYVPVCSAVILSVLTATLSAVDSEYVYQPRCLPDGDTKLESENSILDMLVYDNSFRPKKIRTK